MATVSITRTYSTGQQLSATNYNDDRTELLAGINSINNSQIASDAAISASKISGTAATLAGSETLTNKTLTSPTITSPVIQGNIDGWTLSTDTWVYASSTSFTIAGVNRTAIFTKGTKIKLTQTSSKYFYVTSSSFSTDTTVNITAGDDYSLANAAITSPYYSYADNPQGFPHNFAFTPTNIGFSVDPTSVCEFSVSGGRCFLDFRVTVAGTSNANTWTFNLPINMGGKTNAAVRVGTHNVVDGSASLTTPGLVTILTGGTTLALFKDSASGTWSVTGTKGCSFSVSYPIY